MGKATFTLDRATLRRLREASQRLGRPQSQIVREAIADFSTRVGRLSDAERQRMLGDLDTLLPAIPLRRPEAVDRELRELRRARRQVGERGRPLR